MTTARVSPAMKRLGLVTMLALVGVAVWWLQRPRPPLAAPDTPMPAAAPRVMPSGSPGASAPATPAPAGSIQAVTRVTPEQRRALQERIATAQNARGAVRAADRPRLPEPATPAIGHTDLRQAMRELIPELRACYQRALPTLPSPDVEFTAELDLSGDPDIGTLIDARKLVDTAGTPLPAGFDDCLRSTFQQMALPPLAEGDKLLVHYPFKFSSN